MIDVTKAKELKSIKHPRLLGCCRFQPGREALVAATIEGKILRWDLAGGEAGEIGAHPAWISALAFSPDGARLYSADHQGTLKAWDLSAGTPLWTREAHPVWLKALAISPDGKVLASGARDAVVRLWSASDGTPVRELKGHSRDVYAAAFSPDGRSLVTGGYDGKVLHWDLESGKAVRELDATSLLTKSPEFLCDVGGVRALAFDATGSRLAASGLKDAKSNTFCPGAPAAIVFDWASGKAVQHPKAKDERVDGGVTALRFLADGTLVGVGEGQSGGALWFWAPGRDEPVHVVNAPSCYDLDLHADGSRLLAAAFDAIGRGGNGRESKRGEYVANGGRLIVWTLP